MVKIDDFNVFKKVNMQYVSVIVPCLNEEKNITNLLLAIYHQSYPVEWIEVIIADGGSTDLTRKKITAFLEENRGLKVLVIENTKKIIPAALNLAIQACTGDYIIRMDAHSIPNKDYVEKCINHLKNGIAENVGGLWLIQPASDRLIAQSIAHAASHPFAVGDAKYRYSDKPAFVETVPYGAYRREVFDRIGVFNEDLLANEDYELNARILKSGGKIFFDPEIKTKYIARENLRALWMQYFNYGFWKMKMLKENPRTLRLRQILPPAFVISLILGSIIAMFIPFFRWLMFLEISVYLVFLLTSTIKVVLREKKPGLIVGIPLSIMTMHVSWGLGFIYSFLKTLI